MKIDLILKICLLLTLAMASAGCQVHLGTGPESTAVAETDTQYAPGLEIQDFAYSEPDWPQTQSFNSRITLYLSSLETQRY
jgi:hypothetical protein